MVENAHGHNLRDIFINDTLCSQIEAIMIGYVGKRQNMHWYVCWAS